ncbi:MAG: CO dehydrogenase/CO-methylating acetyl-CoA synthase complex subunit beta [Candidatus Schekmanbacteria bacterium]|nr:CO dehydrogenase/CO-methylating acetyl-CoA synthase complex subunit beta [Candidatus Schekmanbacteria bacterium]
MSKIIASAAIRGAHKVVKRAEEVLQGALIKHGAEKTIEFPNTGYYLPLIYAMTGMEVQKMKDLQPVIDRAKRLLPPEPTEHIWLPYLGHTLDAGMATLFADEVIEVIKYLETPVPYSVTENCPDTGNFWLGAADDIIMRKRGIEFVDGTAPGFAAIVGAAPNVETAVKIARELQEKNLYVFMSSECEGLSFAEQLREAGVQLGWETRLVPFGKDISATVFALGFACRAAMSFGGVQPGDFRRILLYNKNRIFAFVLAFGMDKDAAPGALLDDEKYAQAAGAINFGFPAIADVGIPEILPTGVCTYEHVVSGKTGIPHDKIVQKAIEVRGLKVQISKVPVPVSYGPAFEGERIRKEDMHCEMGGNRSTAFEFVTMKNMTELEDGSVEVIGPEIDGVKEGGVLPVGIWIEVAGRDMQPDFEPILERQIHRLFNAAQGVFHMGQRDANWIRISKEAKKAGFKFSHLGQIIHAKFHTEYNKILDKVQIKIYTKLADVEHLREEARRIYHFRDERLSTLNDDSVDTFYSCTLCQSFAPSHVCIITPERSGLCGAYSWLDGKAAYQIEPTGPNRPLLKGEVLSAQKGQWKGINDFIYQASRNNIERFNAYSLMEDPMTSCGCFECITAILPMTNGVMIVNREYPEMTPSGMKFSTMAGSVGGGLQTPGFMGHSKYYVGSSKYILGEGGLKRITWMPKMLKEEIRPLLEKQAVRIGIPNFVDMIADESVASTEEEVMEFMQRVGHPALSMEPML